MIFPANWTYICGGFPWISQLAMFDDTAPGDPKKVGYIS